MFRCSHPPFIFLLSPFLLFSFIWESPKQSFQNWCQGSGSSITWEAAPMVVRDMADTTLMSWNVSGLNHPVKRGKVFSHLCRLRTDIASLPETNLLNWDHTKLCRGDFLQIFHSDFNSKSRGMAILLQYDIEFLESKTTRDKNGRYVIIQGKFFDCASSACECVCSTWDSAKFFSKLFSLWPDLDSHDLILGRDLNCVLHSALDCLNSKMLDATPSKAARRETQSGMYLFKLGIWVDKDSSECRAAKTNADAITAEIHPVYQRFICCHYT